MLEFRLEEFLRKDFFMFLGYEEIRQILTHPALCVRSELALFNALVSWIDKKVRKTRGNSLKPRGDTKNPCGGSFRPRGYSNTHAELKLLLQIESKVVLGFELN